jgi:hypothetical protein
VDRGRAVRVRLGGAPLEELVDRREAACPGRLLDDQLPQLRREPADHVGRLGVPVGQARGGQADQRPWWLTSAGDV